LGDEELISLVVGAGDAFAFSALYDRHSPAAFSLAFRMMGERPASEDLVQDAFLKVWRSAATYRVHRGSARTWILSIVGNAGVDRMRSQASHRRTQEKAETEAQVISQPSEAFSHTWHIFRRDRVREALEAIPHEQHEVLALAHFSDLSHSEIAERLCLPLGTVKGRMRLGLKKLRDHPELRGMAAG
jgi:RNA polymerase sigma-70 factor, ECF subfamily